MRGDDLRARRTEEGVVGDAVGRFLVTTGRRRLFFLLRAFRLPNPQNRVPRRRQRFSRASRRDALRGSASTTGCPSSCVCAPSPRTRGPWPAKAPVASSTSSASLAHVESSNRASGASAPRFATRANTFITNCPVNTSALASATPRWRHGRISIAFPFASAERAATSSPNARAGRATFSSWRSSDSSASSPGTLTRYRGAFKLAFPASFVRFVVV